MPGACSGKEEPMNDRPIGVFDSGLGGLTVVRALQEQLPSESVVYFGDTARVPYGTKSCETILTFAEQDCGFLMRFDPKLVIVACNTASALALPELAPKVPVPILGVVEPGASEAVRRCQGRGIAVLATEATVSSNAYAKAISALAPNVPVVQQRCPSLVALIEEGRTWDDPIVAMLVAEYLESVKDLDPAVVVLGCTHYPLVAKAIAQQMPRATVVDSAGATALAARDLLVREGALSNSSVPGRLRCYVSDNPQRFREIGGRFLNKPIRDVTMVTPEQFFHESLLEAAGAMT